MTQQSGPAMLGPALDVCTSTQELPLGEIRYGPAGKRYRYVKFVDAVTYAAGQVVTLASATTWDVTNDRSGGSALAGLQPVGVVFQSTVPTQNQYGFVQIAGIADVTIGSASVVAGDYLKPDSSEDGEAEEATAGTDENIVGIAMATIADNATGKVMLMIRGA